MYINPLLFFSLLFLTRHLVNFLVSISALPIPVTPTHIRLYKMLSFRSIFIAATTFATISSAIPAQAAPATPNIPVVHGGASDLGIGGRDGLRGLLGLGEAAILTAPPTSNIFGATGGGGGVCGGLGHSLGGGSFLNSLPGSHGRLLGLGGIGRRPATPTGLLTKRSPTSPGDVFKTCSDGVELVVVKIGQPHIFINFSIQSK